MATGGESASGLAERGMVEVILDACLVRGDGLAHVTPTATGPLAVLAELAAGLTVLSIDAIGRHIVHATSDEDEERTPPRLRQLSHHYALHSIAWRRDSTDTRPPCRPGVSLDGYKASVLAAVVLAVDGYNASVLANSVSYQRIPRLRAGVSCPLDGYNASVLAHCGYSTGTRPPCRPNS
jgi:hypothetical protein